MNPELKVQYANFVSDYMAMDYMLEISEEETSASSYYLPYHAVMKPDITTKKM